MKNIINKNRILFSALLLYGIFFIFNRHIFTLSIYSTLHFLKEMALILPPIFIITGLIMVWIPREAIIRMLGEKSGYKGKLLSLFVGSFSAGPIYAAFPVAHSLLLKGASVGNITIILTTWAVIKIPMLFVEATFLGFRFTALRYFFSLIAVFTLSFIMGKIVSEKEILEQDDNTGADVIMMKLPGYNCGACSYKTCSMFAEKVFSEKALITDCIHINR